MGSIRLLGVVVLLIPFLAINYTALSRMEMFSTQLEEAGSATPSTLLAMAERVSLEREDIYGSARLSAAERDAAVQLCTTSKRSHFEGEARACECMINTIEDRSSRMQFKIAVLAIGRGSQVAGINRIPQLKGYFEAASEHGMTKAAFIQELETLKLAFKSAKEHCRG